MQIAEMLFWSSVALITYTYAIYPVVLALLSYGCGFLRGGRDTAQCEPNDVDLPAVAVIVAAYNEEKHIRQRILNLLAQNYPQDKLHVYVGSDGSTDRTNALVAELASPQVTLQAFTARRGKVMVLNDLVAHTRQPILVFTDANTEFDRNAIRRLVRHFRTRDVGVVCGELILLAHSSRKNHDYAYWRYEQWLKFHEGRIGGLLGANGGIYAMCREAFVSPPSDTIVDDFMITMTGYRRGYRLIYDREAIAYEDVAPDLRNEYRRRVRIGIGNYQALYALLDLLSPFRGVIFFTYFSHKVLRWFVPHLLLVMLAASLALWETAFYRDLFLLQAVGYAYVAITYHLIPRVSLPRLLQIPTYVVVLNAALLIGFVKFFTGQYGAAWKRTER